MCLSAYDFQLKFQNLRVSDIEEICVCGGKCRFRPYHQRPVIHVWSFSFFIFREICNKNFSIAKFEYLKQIRVLC